MTSAASPDASSAEHFVYYVKTLSVVLGRRVGGDTEVDVDLGPSKLISRRHARIAFDFDLRLFTITALGKNGVAINGVQLLPGAPPAELPSRPVPCMRGGHVTRAGLRFRLATCASSFSCRLAR